MSNNKKIAEALAHIQQAEKCLKTSFTKWTPDLDGATSEYVKAATAYRNARELGEARNCYVKAAEVQERMKAPFHAAKSYEQAGLLSKELKDMGQAVHFMERASYMFQEHGTPDTAALCLEKAGKMVEQTNMGQAVQLYKRAADVADCEDRPRQSAENMGRAGRLLIRLNRYEEAVECIKKEIEFYAASDSLPLVYKLVLAIVMLKLTLGDFVAADQFYRSSSNYPMFTDSEEAMAIEELLDAYDNGDEEAGRRVLSSPLIRYMDNAFAKLARDMVIPGGVKTSKKDQGQAAGGGENGAPAQLDDEELEGGLC